MLLGKPQDKKDQNIFKYDVFVSYSSTDLRRVVVAVGTTIQAGSVRLVALTSAPRVIARTSMSVFDWLGLVNFSLFPFTLLPFRGFKEN